MRRSELKKFSTQRNAIKAIETTRFLGLDIGAVKSGLLTDCDNITVLSGGAVKSLLAEQRIDIGADTASLEGVYTCYSEYDDTYEIPVDADWIYENICPRNVLNYKAGIEKVARMLVADVGRPGKVNGGYRNIIGAFCSGESIYVIYDAVYNIIDQRRLDELARVGDGYTVTFDSKMYYSEGTSSTVYTLSQLWLDVITDGEVKSCLVDAKLVNLGVVADTYSKALLVSTDGVKFRYVRPEYKPDIGESYPYYYDLIYTEVYPIIYKYPVNAKYSDAEKHIVRYCNKESGEEPYGDVGEHLMLLPDMRAISVSGGSVQVEETAADIPEMKGGVQHMNRLFGFLGDRLYASVAGNCSDFTEAENNIPPTGGWQTVTSDEGGFTAIASFDGSLIAFTGKNMLTVRGNELPFSVSHVGSYGCKRQESVAAYGGWLYFASATGILRYNGSRVECISHSLSPEIAFEDALIFSFGDMIAVFFIEYDGVYLYNPQSECWTRKKSEFLDMVIPDGFKDTLFLNRDGVYSAHKFSGDADGFSFSVSLGGGARKHVTAVTVTARLGFDAVLLLTDKSGNVLMTVDNLFDETVTRTCMLKNKYVDSDSLHFKGSGDVTVYEVRAEYKPVANRFRNII